MKNRNEIVASNFCIYCGLTKDKHHEFEAGTKHRGCVCDRKSWAKEPGPICDNYRENGADGYCLNCEHDKECHE